MKVWECRLLRERDLSSHPRPEALSERAFGTSKLQEASLKKKKKKSIYLFILAAPGLSCGRERSFSCHANSSL